jgi:hypothetical protein
LLVTLDAKYSENEYLPNPHSPLLLSFSPKLSSLVCFYFLLLSWFPHSSCPLFVNSNGNDSSDDRNGSGGNYDDYGNEEKAATPTVVTPTAMAMAAPTVMVAMTITAKAMADATSVNCNGKRDYGNNNRDGATATVMATTATAMATATVMAMTKVAMATATTEM